MFDTKTETLIVDQSSAAVIGGGLAGLTAAATLAKAGEKVVLLESADSLGGRAQTRDHDGFQFNLGPRALYVSGRAREILSDLGVRPKGRVPSLQNAGAWVDGEIESLPVDFWSLMKCSWLGGRGRFEVIGFLARLQGLNPESLKGMSAKQWLELRFRREPARDLIAALIRLTTYAASLERLDAGVALRQLQMGFRRSVHYLDGGWQTLVDRLAAEAVAHGAVLRTGVRVKTLSKRETGFSLEIQGQEDMVVSQVVTAVGPKVLERLLGLPDETFSARPVYAACLDVALKELPIPDRLFVQGVDRPYYFSVHSATADLAPGGGALVHLLRYLKDDEHLRREEVTAEMEGALDQFQPGWREFCVHRQMMPRLVVCHDLPSGDSMADIELADYPGLYLAGDWVGGEAILADAAVGSGFDAATRILNQRASQRAPAREIAA